MKVKVIIIGAGDRGQIYAKFAKHFPERMQVVGVAEPREFYRNKIVEEHNLKSENVFKDWKEAAKKEKFADAVVIATQDEMHRAPTEAFADLGYHILLEKPMAANIEDCKKIVEAVERNKVIFSVCHVLRYTAYTKRLKEVLRSGSIGEIVSVQHLEPVGYWHQAHSFVRGNWRNEQESTFMLLAKSCHDLDWLRYIIDEKCLNISSFGSLKHFRKDKQPDGAAARCLDCKVENNCAYSAKKIYLEKFKNYYDKWPVNVLTSVPTKDGVLEALENGPYGRCVFECDNDVVDHQVVNFEFENEITASFTMTAFNKAAQRKTSIYGTEGEIYGDGRYIKIFKFLDDSEEIIDTKKEIQDGLQGHGGGDFGIMDNFVKAVSENNEDLILTGKKETLESHLMVFAGEKARLNKEVVNVQNLMKEKLDK